MCIRDRHWVCFSSINCPPGVVDVYDNAPYSSSTSKVLLKQVAAVAKCQDNTLEDRFIDVQVQEGTNDYGLFAIAFATALCKGVDPYSLSLDQKSIYARTLVKLFWRGRDVNISIVTPTKEICKKESEKNAESACLLPLSFALGPTWYFPWKSGPVWKMQGVVSSKMFKYPSGRFCRQILCLVLPWLRSVLIEHVITFCIRIAETSLLNFFAMAFVEVLARPVMSWNFGP